MKHVKILLIAGLLTSLATGCALTDSAKSAFKPVATFLQSGGGDEPLGDQAEDEWAFVGEEARGGRPRERDPDRWWRNLMMSERAKNIERSLGID